MMSFSRRSSVIRVGGFTLVEMVTSLAILSILLVACGSIVSMATRATGNSALNSSTQLQTADAASQITDDLNDALNFTQRTAFATTFTVPDRLGTGSPQTISYNWTGNAGDPLLRTFNGGTPATLLSGVRQLNFSFISRLMGLPAGPTEQLLFSHDAAVGSFKDYNLDNKNWGSQYFLPNLPALTNSYTLTRIQLVLKAGKQSDALLIRLVTPDALFRPTGATIAQTTIYQSALSNTYEWVNIPFAASSNLNPLQPLCITLTNAAGSTNVGAVQIDQAALPILSGADWSSTTNSGGTWTTGTGTTTVRVYVYGTVP